MLNPSLHQSSPPLLSTPQHQAPSRISIIRMASRQDIHTPPPHPQSTQWEALPNDPSPTSPLQAPQPRSPLAPHSASQPPNPPS